LASTGRYPLDSEYAVGLAHFPGVADYALTPDAYAEHIARVTRTVAVPVIASLNGG
jgi:2-methylisocitrate lyase-like PEP mutase family enzyme